MSKTDILWCAGELTALISSIIFYLKTKKNLKKTISLLNFIQKAYPFTPKILTDLLESKNLSLTTNLYKYKENKNASSFRAFVKGKIISHDPIKSILDKKKKYVLRKTIIEPLYSNSKDSNPKDYFIENKYVSDFLIKDEDFFKFLFVKFNSRVNFENVLKKIGKFTSIPKSSLLVNMLTKVIFLFKFFLTLFRFNLKGLKIGSKGTEYGTEVGDDILAFGKILFDKKKKILLMHKPEFFLKNKIQLVNLLKFRIKKWKNINYLSLFMMLLSSILVIRRFLIIYRKLKKKISFMITKFRMEKLRKFSDLLTDSFKCIICIDNAKNVIFIPCYHMVICQVCYDSLEKNQCPICRKEISDSVNIFIV